MVPERAALPHGHRSLGQVRHEGNRRDGEPNGVRGARGDEDDHVAEDDQHDLHQA